MNNMIACNLNNFTLNKNISILSNGNVEKIKCENIDNLSKMLYNISKEKNINNIAIGGDSYLARKIVREIEEMEMSEYGNYKLQIIII